MKDSTPQLHAAAANRYRTLFDHSADALLIIENDKFVDCNQAAVDMLRYPDKNALLQRRPFDLVSYSDKNALSQCHPADLSPEFQPDGQRSIDKANKILANVVNFPNQRFEWVHVKSDGELFTVEVLLTAIPAAKGYTIHTVWRDLTERKQLEKELRHSQKMEALGNLAGGIAHDFNNILVPIVTYSDLLAEALQGKPELHKWAQEISHAGTLAATLVKKLLTVSRKDIRQPVTLDLEEATKNLLGILRTLVGEDVVVDFHGTRNELWIETDPGDVEQIVLNLASNARDALPKGGKIKLALSSVQRSDGPFASLEMTDNGVGMDAETLEQIFVPFFTTKELGRGTGLGMSTVYELVTKAHGQINVRSSPGKGTTIEALFPIVDREVSESVGVAREASRPFDEAEVFADAQILVVEDDIQIARVIRSVLGKAGFRVSAASNGIQALEILESETPDLILTDVVMSEMSGPLMIKKMNAKGIHVPVVFLSGYPSDHLTAYGFDAKKVALIRKPFIPSTLVNQVREALASARKNKSTH